MSIGRRPTRGIPEACGDRRSPSWRSGCRRRRSGDRTRRVVDAADALLGSSGPCEREDQRVVALQLAEPPYGVLVVGQRVVGKDAAGHNIATHGLTLLS